MDFKHSQIQPDMASFVMLKMATENEQGNPHAAQILRRDRYMHDLMHSCSNSNKAVHSIKELDRVLATGSFKIKEWLTSEDEVVSHLAQDTVANPDEGESPAKTNRISLVNLDGEKGVKTLGIARDPQRDVLSFTVKKMEIGSFTKRTILSNIWKLYDSLSLTSAVTIRATTALQEIWRSKQYDWDDPLPKQMATYCRALFTELETLKFTEFPR